MSRSRSRSEQALLDEALGDPLLLNSLRSEDARRTGRRRRAAVLFGLSVAAVVCFFVIRASMAGKANSLITEGWSLWSAQKFAEAEEKFSAAAKVSPDQEGVWNGLGWSRVGQGKLDEALEAFRKCLEIAPKHPAALNGVGQVLLSQRKYDEAEKALLEAAPSADAAWYGLGRVYLLKGEFAKAEPWWQKIANKDPKNELAAKLLSASQAGSLGMELRNQIEPPVPTPAVNGWQLLNSGKLKDAQAAFEAVLKNAPDDLAAANGLGFTLLNLGEPAKAKPYFELCLKANEKSAGAMNGLARCLKAEGNRAEAIAWWEKLDQDFPGPNAGTALLGETYLEQGEYAKAIPYLEKLTKAEPENPQFKQSLENAHAGLAKQKR